MKSTAMKITSGVIGGILIVALVVVAALAIAGVFNLNNGTDIAAADGDAQVKELHMFRGFDASTVLYIQSVNGGTPNGTADTFIHVVDNEYNKVAMVWDTVKDADGNIGVKPANGWKEGMFYSISLAAGYRFVNEDYKEYDSFMCIVAAKESTEADTKVKENIIMLQPNTFVAKQNAVDASKYTLTVQGTAPTGDNLVFVCDDGMNSVAYRQVADMGRITDNGDSYSLTVEEAEVSDVYDYIYVNKTYDVQASDIDFDFAATEASIRNSDWYLAAMHYLYGEDLAETTKEESKWVTVKFDPSFTPGSPSVVKLNITISFNVFKDKDGNPDNSKGGIVIRIANTFTPVFDVHIQENDEGKAFDVALDLDVQTSATLEAKYANSWSSLDEENNKLTDIATGLAQLVSKITSSKLADKDGNAKPYTFAKWIIPIGTLPICIEDTLGFELGASFAGEVGAVATNSFHATIGAVYAGGKLNSYHNVDDTFHFDNITIAGTAEAKVGLLNQVGISAYGTISINLGVHVGVYADVAGRLSMSGDDIVALFKNEKAFNIVPAYYFETGVYLDLEADGKVFGFTVKRFNLLSKKFPLYSTGHKYLPMSYIADENAVLDADGNEVLYMQNSYFYLVGWDVNALDIQQIGGSTSAMNLPWSEFDYEVGANLRVDGNVVYANKAGEFEDYIKVTSKVNKDLTKTIKVVKNPEAPTTPAAEQVFDRNDRNAIAMWTVMLNSSKWLGVTLDGEPLLDTQYSYANDTLRIEKDALAGKAYGAHSVVVESSKGYLNLVVRIINSAEVTVDDATVVFDKADAKATVWNMNLQGNAVTALNEGVAAVNAKYYSYRESVQQFVILASYWTGKACGSYTESLTLSNGKVYNLNVVVKDTREAKLNTDVYEYVAGSNAALYLDVETYDNAANVVSEVTLGDATANAVAAELPAIMFADKAIGTYAGSVTVGGKVLPFTVKVIGAEGSLVINSKKKTFVKSSNEDVVFQAKIPANANVTIAGCDGYVVGDASITIKAAFLKAQKGAEWQGTVTCGSNSVVITVVLVNDVLPSLSANSFVTSGDTVSVAWDLQDVSYTDLVVEGIAAEQYVATASGITIYTADLAYGANDITVYTPVNSMSLTIKREGTPSISSNCVINVGEAGDGAEYSLDVAHLTFDYVVVDNANLLASAYRYNAGKLTFANEFIYNLSAGSYDVHVYMKEGNKLDTKLTIQGEIPVSKPVGLGNIASPFLIYTAEQLAAVSTYVANTDSSAYYKLMADIDMKGYTFTPIGGKDDAHAYKGVFDGNGYSISNLTISDPVSYGKDGYLIGMFGYLGADGIVQDLRLNSVTVNFAKSGSVSAGIVAGRSAGKIVNVTVFDGNISAESKSWMDIKNAYFDLGAVVGYCDSGIIQNVSVAANISGKVKGLNIAGIQIGGRKSLINVGTVVGYFTTEKAFNKEISKVQVAASITCEADSNTINQNGWYGYSDLTPEEAEACIKRVRSIG